MSDASLLCDSNIRRRLIILLVYMPRIKRTTAATGDNHQLTRILMTDLIRIRRVTRHVVIPFWYVLLAGVIRRADAFAVDYRDGRVRDTRRRWRIVLADNDDMPVTCSR